MKALSLDMLRTFVVVVDQGSFAAAARQSNRAQSAITYSIQKLEALCGFSLFDRRGYRPFLTPAGRALLSRARRVLEATDMFAAQAAGLARGLEPEVALAVDGMFPTTKLMDITTRFREAWPTVTLRIMIENLGATVQRVLDGQCELGVVAAVLSTDGRLSRRRIANVRLLPIASPKHPLALCTHTISIDEIREHVQLVLTDRSGLSLGREFGVFSTQTWKVSDLGAKHEMLRAGLGWASMPEHMVAAELRVGHLALLDFEDQRRELGMDLVWHADATQGPATAWLKDCLTETDSELAQR